MDGRDVKRKGLYGKDIKRPEERKRAGGQNGKTRGIKPGLSVTVTVVTVVTNRVDMLQHPS